MPLASGTRLGTYEVRALIGAGGMGEVYLAHDTRLNRDVALKVLPEAFSRDTQRMARFEREAKLLASLNHPNIAAIYGLEESGPIRALVMELVEGPTVAERIAGGPVPVDEALPIARQVADAVEYAHEHNVMHRDLKPANIKVTAEGVVKVLDFGLAKALSDEPTAEDISNSPTLSMAATRQGVILGTASYMSPEQARGKKVDKRTDVWALGCVLYEMLTGKQAFHGEDVTEILAAVVMKEPAFDALPANTPPAIRTLLRRCLRKDRRERLPDAGAARIEIQEALSAPAEAEPAGAAQRKSRERLLAIAMAMAVVIAAAGWGAYLYLRPAPVEPQAVRFSVGPPEGVTLSANPGFLSLSPDGSKLAFASQGIWIRALDSEVIQRLDGTEGATAPFWSADSRFVGFSMDGRLRKIAVSGGPTQTLVNTPSRAGTWNREGVVLFAGAGEASINRVSSGGGPATPVTALDTSRQETDHNRPHFLPDGDHFLYFARSRDAGNNAIYVDSLRSPGRKLLLNVMSNAFYVPPGYLLFNREGTLMAQPFDTRRLELTGEEIPIAEDVQFSGLNGTAAFAASENGVLIYRIASGATGTRLTWFDRTGKPVGVLGDPAAYRSVEISPDGKRVAVTIQDQGGATSDIWLLDVARGIKSRFTFDPRVDQYAVWSPDGSRIIFSSNRKGRYDLYQKASDMSGTEEVVLEDGLQKFVSSWSSDGRFLLYSANSTGLNADNDVMALPLSGVRKPVPFQAERFREGFSQFSPDGRWVAYISYESGEAEAYVAPFPGPGGKQQISQGGATNLRWRPDGSELFYLSPDNTLMAVAVNGKGPSFEVGATKPLFQTTAVSVGGPYDVSPDGQRFLINTITEQTESAPIRVVVNWMAGLRK